LHLAAEVVGSEGLRWGVVVAVFLAGLRHGFDLDHIAAITDITSSQTDRRRSFRLATVYATGHALVLLVLGGVAVLVGARIPPAADRFVGRIIGLTLVFLGAYVLYSLVRFRRNFRFQSRWMLILAGVRRSLVWLKRHRPEQTVIEHVHPHSAGHHPHVHVQSGGSALGGRVLVETETHVHPHRHVVTVPTDPFTEYGVGTSFGVGMIHGVGAETPSQILIFSTAAGLAGSVGGIAVIVAFVAGLFAGNSILALAASAGFAGGRKVPRMYILLAGVTAILSIYMGVLYLWDRADLFFGM
jgi:hypothetical protein